MLTLSFISLTSMLVTTILVVLTITLSEKSIKEREKMTPFECGFSPFKKARSPFSIRFFMTTLIFLIFDMEIALVLPMGVLAKLGDQTYWLFTSAMIVFILLAGLLHEWKNGVLSWIS